MPCWDAWKVGPNVREVVDLKKVRTSKPTTHLRGNGVFFTLLVFTSKHNNSLSSTQLKANQRVLTIRGIHDSRQGYIASHIVTSSIVILLDRAPSTRQQQLLRYMRL